MEFIVTEALIIHPLKTNKPSNWNSHVNCLCIAFDMAHNATQGKVPPQQAVEGMYIPREHYNIRVDGILNT